jgi:hypothetical protein
VAIPGGSLILPHALAALALKQQDLSSLARVKEQVDRIGLGATAGAFADLTRVQRRLILFPAQKIFVLSHLACPIAEAAQLQQSATMLQSSFRS